DAVRGDGHQRRRPPGRRDVQQEGRLRFRAGRSGNGITEETQRTQREFALKRVSSALPAVCILLGLACVASAKPAEYFAVQVVDEAMGRGVPMVELQTTSGARYYTDSNGLIAFYEPGLMGRKVWFGVSSHGYELPPDGFGIRGVTLETKPG